MNDTRFSFLFIFRSFVWSFVRLLFRSNTCINLDSHVCTMHRIAWRTVWRSITITHLFPLCENNYLSIAACFFLSVHLLCVDTNGNGVCNCCKHRSDDNGKLTVHRKSHWLCKKAEGEKGKQIINCDAALIAGKTLNFTYYYGLHCARRAWKLWHLYATQVWRFVMRKSFGRKN